MVLYNQSIKTKPCPRGCGNRIGVVMRKDNYISEVDGAYICGACKGTEDIEATIRRITNREAE